MTSSTASRLLTTVLVAVLAAGLLVALPATGRASSDLAVGVHVHALWSDYDTATRAAVFDRLADAGVEWVRVDVGWASVEEECSGCPQQWHLGQLDETLTQASQRGLKVLAVLWRTPSWANDGDLLAPPDDVAEYGRAAGWLADRFAGRVAAWQVWNEPNLDGYFHGDTDDYAELLRQAGPAIRAADPDTKVVLGGPSLNDTDWLADVYAAGAAPWFDVMATQPYMAPADAEPERADNGEPGRIRHVEAVRELMLANGDGDKPIWFTEFGWSAHATAPDAPNWRRGVTEQVQADYLVRALRMIDEQYPYVTNAFWYNARERDSDDPHMAGYGLLRRDLSPRPAFTALRDHLANAPADPVDDVTDTVDEPTDTVDEPTDPDGESLTTFHDVVDSVFARDIRWIAEERITLGCDATSSRYCPDRSVTRGQMAAFLGRALDLAPDTTAFGDVPGHHPFADDIAALAAAGITVGCNPPDNTDYCPDRAVTRGQMAAFLGRALDLAPVPTAFGDVPRHHPFADDIAALAAAGITVGCNPPDNTDYCPDRPVTRGQMAAFLRRGLAG